MVPCPRAGQLEKLKTEVFRVSRVLLIAEELSPVADAGSWQGCDCHGHRVAPWTSNCAKLTARGETIVLALADAPPRSPALEVLVHSERGF